MNRSQIIAIQGKIGAVQDGVWGPKSKEACKAYLLSLMPKPSPWPKPDDDSMIMFYGRPGSEHNLVPIDVSGMGVKYEGAVVRSIRCHARVADSLRDILAEIASGPSAWILAQYGGCFNNRNMRGSNRVSKHAWGAAIDLAPDTNGLRVGWPCSADMPFDAIEAFSKRGWTSAGAWWARDGMHFEATDPS